MQRILVNACGNNRLSVLYAFRWAGVLYEEQAASSDIIESSTITLNDHICYRALSLLSQNHLTSS